MAIEIARQFTEKKKKVNFIGLLDGWAFYPKEVLQKSVIEKSMARQHEIIKQQFDSYDITSSDFLLDLQHHRSSLLSQYQLPILDQQLTLFKAKELLPLLEPMEAHDNYWQAYSTKPVKIYPVPGLHDTMLLEPHVQELAKYFNESLEELPESV